MPLAIWLIVERLEIVPTLTDPLGALPMGTYILFLYL